MSVQAKFKVQSISRTGGSKYNQQTKQYDPCETQTIRLQPVYDSDPTSENGKFYAATPGGQIELGIVNAEAGNYFELDAEYLVNFEKA